jgi:hypothetical protein
MAPSHGLYMDMKTNSFLVQSGILSWILLTNFRTPYSKSTGYHCWDKKIFAFSCPNWTCSITGWPACVIENVLPSTALIVSLFGSVVPCSLIKPHDLLELNVKTPLAAWTIHAWDAPRGMRRAEPWIQSFFILLKNDCLHVYIVSASRRPW